MGQNRISISPKQACVISVIIFSSLWSFCILFSNAKGNCSFFRSIARNFHQTIVKEIFSIKPKSQNCFTYPQSAKDATSEELFSQSDVYNTIEKKLLKYGLNLKDSPMLASGSIKRYFEKILYPKDPVSDL
ncbi:MAG: hypothetical protein ACI87N_003565 [Flavobacteriales bacterium]